MSRPQVLGKTTVSNILEHHGIKGMRWGVRRSAAQLGHPVSSDAATARKHASTAKKQGHQALSNEELKHLVDRMDLEQRYSNLRTKSHQRTVVGKGSKFAGEILAQTAKQQAAKALGYGISKLVAEAMKGK